MAGAVETAQTIFSVASSLLYVYVGVMTGRRTVPPEARLALRSWQAWWIGLGLVGLLGAVVNPWLQRAASETAYLAYIIPLIVLLLGIVAALVYYLLYLYTGSPRVLLVTIVYFGALTTFFLLLFNGAFSPEGYPRYEEIDGDQEYRLGPEGGPTETYTFVGAVLLVLPLLASAVAYALLYLRLDGKTERYRIGMVSGALVVWFGSSLLGTLVGRFVDLPEWWPIVTQLIAFTAALMVLVAYYPPKPWREKYGLRSLSDER